MRVGTPVVAVPLVWRSAEKPGAKPNRPVIFECVGVPGIIDGIIISAPLFSRVVVVGACMEPDQFRPVMAINKEIDLADGSNPIALTTGPATDENEEPVWSADGTKIVFTSARTGGQEIWTMNADGTGQTRLTTGAGGGAGSENPSWSPDGTKIAFTRSDTTQSVRSDEVWAMNADGTNQTQLTTTAAGFGSERPAYSPDGTKIVFGSDRDDNDDLWVMNADGSNPLRLTTRAMLNNGQPNWQPIPIPIPPTTTTSTTTTTVAPPPPDLPNAPAALPVVARPAFTG